MAQHKLLSKLAILACPEKLKVGEKTNTESVNSIQILADLIGFSQALCKQLPDNMTEYFCQGVAHITGGKLQLFLSREESLDGSKLALPICACFPVQFLKRHYGMLYVISDPEPSANPDIPLTVAQLLAHICGL